MKIYNNVSQTQLSIAKYSGAIKINGQLYYYDYANDALVHEKDIKEYKEKIKEIKGTNPPKFPTIK